MNDHRDLVIRYYDACNAADRAALLELLTPDMAHYFLAGNPGSAAVHGAQRFADAVCLLQRSVQGRWVVDHYLGAGDEAVIEWTLYWTSPKTAERIATRGAEMYVFRGGRIAEVRAYYRQRHQSIELDGFDYAARGYSLPGAESSAAQPAGSTRRPADPPC